MTLRQDLALPPLGAYGLKPADVPGLVRQARQSSSMKGNPIDLTEGELSDLLTAAL